MCVKGLLYKRATVFCVVLFVLLGNACDQADQDAAVLSHAEMVKILTEIYLTEQKVNRFGLARDSAEHEFDRFKKVVFKKENISDSVFRKSFNYYMDRPKEMELIYTALVDSLSLMEQRFESSLQAK
jgi:hypothetical protein